MYVLFLEFPYLVIVRSLRRCSFAPDYSGFTTLRQRPYRVRILLAHSFFWATTLSTLSLASLAARGWLFTYKRTFIVPPSVSGFAPYVLRNLLNLGLTVEQKAEEGDTTNQATNITLFFVLFALFAFFSKFPKKSF